MTSRMTSVAVQAIAVLLVLSVFGSQTAFAAGPQAAPPTSSTGQTITVPAGTVIPLTLVSQIKSKSTQVGDPVRAQVAFPITAGTQVAIPAGTYVEGVVTSLTAQAKKTRQPDVQIHFTRLVYANGYTATLDAANTQASAQVPGTALPDQLSEASDPPVAGAGRTHIAFYGGEGFTSRAQTGTLPPLSPLPSPPVGLIVGIVGGFVAAMVALSIVARHHKSNADFLLFDAGWQFQMALTTPLGLDAAQVTAAANLPPR